MWHAQVSRSALAIITLTAFAGVAQACPSCGSMSHHSGAASSAASSAASGAASNAAANAASNAAAAAASSAINGAMGAGGRGGRGGGGAGSSGGGHTRTGKVTPGGDLTVTTTAGAVAIATAIMGKDPPDPVQQDHQARVNNARNLDNAWKALDNEYNRREAMIAKRDFERSAAEKIEIDRAGGIGVFQQQALQVADQRDATYKQFQQAQLDAKAHNSYRYVP